MRTNRELSLAIKRALATGTIALCGAGAVTAFAQPTPTTKATTAQTSTTPDTTTRTDTTKAASTKDSIVLAQAVTPPANAQSSTPQLQTVVVTGSLIRRTDLETPSPIQVISSTDLTNSGYTDISDVLRNVTANGANTLSQSFNGAFAAGASGVSLRGLTVADTLVLIDGERTVQYPLNDDNERSFVDVSSLPLYAVDQVQVLKDSASSTYGADAIGGVVNVILRKTYQGSSVTTDMGDSQHDDGMQEHIAGIWGIGDLASDGYNWYMTAEYRHEDQILAANRSGQWDSQDWRQWGGMNLTPGAGDASAEAYLDGTGFPNSTVGYYVNPDGTYQFLGSGCDSARLALDECEFANKAGQLQPATSRFSFLTKFTKTLGSNWTSASQVSVFESRAEQVASIYDDTEYPAGISYTAFSPSVAPHGVPATGTYLITIPGDYPGNVSGTPQALQYSFSELGYPTTTTDTWTYRFLEDLEGSVAGWNVTADGGVMYSRMIQRLTGQLEPVQLQDYLDGGGILSPTNGAVEEQAFSPLLEITPTSTLELVDVHGSRELFQLPDDGKVSLALGAQWNREAMDDQAPAIAEDGIQTEPGGPVYVLGSQTDSAAFAELDGQITKMLEVDASGRYDHYNNGVGGAATPKIGVKFQPISMFALRGTWGKGFRAPSIAEGVSSGEAFIFNAFADPALCPNPGTPTAAGNFVGQCAENVGYALTAGKDLKPVKSTNYTLGFVFQPLDSVSVSADYYHINLSGDITLASTSNIVRINGCQNLEQWQANGTEAPASTCSAATGLTNQGAISFIQDAYVNANSTQTDGVDVDLQTHYDLGAAGRLHAEVTWTHLMSYILTEGGESYQLAGTHGPEEISGDTGNPKDRVDFSLTWNKGPFSITPAILYTSRFGVEDPSAGVADCASAIYGSLSPHYIEGAPYSNSLCNIAAFVETDVYLQYQATERLSFHGSILNVLNRQPPVDVVTYGGGASMPYDAAFDQSGAVGRYFQAGVTYNF